MNFQVWGMPAHKWGPWVEPNFGFGRGKYILLEFSTSASLPSAGEAEIDYYDISQGHQTKRVVIPGKTYIKVGNCICPVKIRARSYSTGQLYDVKAEYEFLYAY